MTIHELTRLLEDGLDEIQRGGATTFSLVGFEPIDRRWRRRAIIVARQMLEERCLPADVRLRADGSAIDVIPWLT